MVGVPKILDSLWKATNANATDATGATHARSATRSPESFSTMSVEETSEIVMEEAFGEGTMKEVEAIMEGMSETGTEKATGVDTASQSAQEFFGLHQPAAPFKSPRPVVSPYAFGDTGNANVRKVFNVQAAQLLDPFLAENPPVRVGKKRAISAITTPRKSGRERKPTQKVQDSIQIWEDEATQKILDYMRQSEKSQKTLEAHVIKLQESMNQMTDKIDQQSNEIIELKT